MKIFLGKPAIPGITAACLIAATQLALAADIKNGETLLKGNCTACHDDSMYSRKDKRITSLDGLNKQVSRCELSLGLKWFDKDINDVVSYLNQTYYHFK